MTDEELLKKVNFLMDMMSNPSVGFGIRSSVRQRFEDCIDYMVEKLVADVSERKCSDCTITSGIKCCCCDSYNGYKNYKPDKWHIEEVIEAHDKHK